MGVSVVLQATAHVNVCSSAHIKSAGVGGCAKVVGYTRGSGGARRTQLHGLIWPVVFVLVATPLCGCRGSWLVECGPGE